MAPPSTQQRLESLEEKLDLVEASLTERISAAVERAMAAIRVSLSTEIAACLAESSRKSQLDLEALGEKLEGRLDRTRENQERMFGALRGEQVKIQTEIRSVLTEKKNNAGTISDPTIDKMKGGVQEGGVGSSSNRDLTNTNLEWGSEVKSMGNGNPGGGTNWRFKRLDMPLFDGTNPDGWILRAERYFQFYRLTEEDRVEAAVVALEGEALLWFQWENRWRPVETWAEMKTLVRRRFRSTASGTLHEQWLAHQQTETVGEYRRKFIELLAPLERVPEEIAKGQFLNGLKEEVRVEVRLLGPKSLDHAMDLALMVEDKLRVGSVKKAEPRYSSSSKGASSYAPSSPPFKNNGSMYSMGSVSPRTILNSSASSGGSSTYSTNRPRGEVRRLSDRELQMKREKGLCYRCDEKWSIGHRCKRKELSVLLTCEEEEEDGTEISPTSPVYEEQLEAVLSKARIGERISALCAQARSQRVAWVEATRVNESSASVRFSRLIVMPTRAHKRASLKQV